MSEKMSEKEWMKFCDPQKNPKIFAYLQASGKDFEQTRREFNTAAGKETFKVTLNAVMISFVLLNAVMFVSNLLNQKYALMCVSLFSGVACSLTAANIKTTKGDTKRALIKSAKHHAETGRYVPYL